MKKKKILSLPRASTVGHEAHKSNGSWSCSRYRRPLSPRPASHRILSLSCLPRKLSHTQSRVINMAQILGNKTTSRRLDPQTPHDEQINLQIYLFLNISECVPSFGRYHNNTRRQRASFKLVTSPFRTKEGILS